ncbi:MAG: adenylate/guanylate cyclase domain-containing protein, partial [Thermoplasmatales archaeon]
AEIKSFSAISEKMNVDHIISILHGFYTTAQEIFFKNNGTFGNISGNQLMAVFGLISSDNGAPHNAIKAALEMQDAAKKLIKNKSNKDNETIEIGIGINTGDIVSGNIRFKNRLDYTVLGDCVDIASKLQQISKGGEIIIGEKTFLCCQGDFKIQKLGKIKSENNDDNIICYKIIS